jgi:putative ABC transport system ATP-binding protein
VHEKDYCKEPYATKIRSEYIGFVFQQFNLLSDLTVSENIALPLILNNYRKKTVVEYTDRKLKLVGLENRRNHRPFELSGGQQQRVAIARALITNPKVLLADEPTGNLDVNTAKEIMRLLYEMNKNLNQSTIVVTHDPVIAAYADRVIFFHDGENIDEYKNSDEKDDNIREILARFHKNIGEQYQGEKMYG